MLNKKCCKTLKCFNKCLKNVITNVKNIKANVKNCYNKRLKNVRTNIVTIVMLLEQCFYKNVVRLNDAWP